MQRALSLRREEWREGEFLLTQFLLYRTGMGKRHPFDFFGGWARIVVLQMWPSADGLPDAFIEHTMHTKPRPSAEGAVG